LGEKYFCGMVRLKSLSIIKISISFSFVVFFIFLPVNTVYGHEDENGVGESPILSRYIGGNIELSTNSGQWEKSFEKDFDSIWDHDISVKSLNNGTNVFFLLSWVDPTKDDGEIKDGAMIVFESKLEKVQEHEEIEIMENGDGINEVWNWDVSKTDNSSGRVLDSSWENQKWTVLFGRSVLTSEQNKIMFESGIKQEDFIKIAVWDGSMNESFEQIDNLPHADFILLPRIDTYPKDVFVWSALLVVGAVSFLFVERKLHFKKEMSLNE